MNMFESLDAFRTHCGEPTMPIEECPICSKIPDSCSRENVDCAVRDDRPPQTLLLAKLMGGGSDGEVLRCPTCRRLYLYDVAFPGAENYHASWNRHDVEDLFNLEWCVTQRLPNHHVQRVLHGLFPHHAIVRFEDSDGWSALDGNNQLIALDKVALAKLIDRDPPRGTMDLDLAKRYAAFVDGIENPGDRRHDAFHSIVWRESLWPFEQQRVDQARAASLVEGPVAERVGEQIRVRFWVTSEHRLVCRVITVQPDGHYLREDTVTADYLPIPARRQACFESLDAFRAHCGAPTMPLEQCPICSNLPERCTQADEEPTAMERLEHFIGENVRRCPTCRRLYSYDSQSFGNDIYTGNDNAWQLERCSVEVLFDRKWCVQQRVPEHRVDAIRSDRFFPNHVLVELGSELWAALDANNQLVMLDSHDAIVRLIDIDPPSVIADVDLAKRYVLFIDEIERPGDKRPDYFEYIFMRDELTAEETQQIEDARAATGLPTMASPPNFIDMRATAERDGDRLLVRSWVMSQKRLICRWLTLQPNGRVTVKDAVIAENLPIL